MAPTRFSNEGWSNYAKKSTLQITVIIVSLLTLATAFEVVIPITAEYVYYLTPITPVSQLTLLNLDVFGIWDAPVSFSLTLVSALKLVTVLVLAISCWNYVSLKSPRHDDTITAHRGVLEYVFWRRLPDYVVYSLGGNVISRRRMDSLAEAARFETRIAEGKDIISFDVVTPKGDEERRNATNSMDPDSVEPILATTIQQESARPGSIVRSIDPTELLKEYESVAVVFVRDPASTSEADWIKYGVVTYVQLPKAAGNGKVLVTANHVLHSVKHEFNHGAQVMLVALKETNGVRRRLTMSEHQLNELKVRAASLPLDLVVLALPDDWNSRLALKAASVAEARESTRAYLAHLATPSGPLAEATAATGTTLSLPTRDSRFPLAFEHQISTTNGDSGSGIFQNGLLVGIHRGHTASGNIATAIAPFIKAAFYKDLRKMTAAKIHLAEHTLEAESWLENAPSMFRRQGGDWDDDDDYNLHADFYVDGHMRDVTVNGAHWGDVMDLQDALYQNYDQWYNSGRDYDLDDDEYIKRQLEERERDDRYFLYREGNLSSSEKDALVYSGQYQYYGQESIQVCSDCQEQLFLKNAARLRKREKRAKAILAQTEATNLQQPDNIGAAKTLVHEATAFVAATQEVDAPLSPPTLVDPADANLMAQPLDPDVVAAIAAFVQMARAHGIAPGAKPKPDVAAQLAANRPLLEALQSGGTTLRDAIAMADSHAAANAAKAKAEADAAELLLAAAAKTLPPLTAWNPNDRMVMLDQPKKEEKPAKEAPALPQMFEPETPNKKGKEPVLHKESRSRNTLERARYANMVQKTMKAAAALQGADWINDRNSDAISALASLFEGAKVNRDVDAEDDYLKQLTKLCESITSEHDEHVAAIKAATAKERQAFRSAPGKTGASRKSRTKATKQQQQSTQQQQDTTPSSSTAAADATSGQTTPEH